MCIDSQKSRVYAWERASIACKDSSLVSYANAQSIIDYIWASEKLEYPPRLCELDVRNTKVVARGNRFHIKLRPDRPTPTWIILHELAHSMTSDVDGNTSMHNRNFVGVYARLIEKYLNIPMTYLLYTLNEFNVEINIMASPTFLD